MVENPKKYICETNNTHIVESLPDDLFCPLCPEGTNSMLIPKKEDNEKKETAGPPSLPSHEYFIALNGEQKGPFNLEQLANLEFKKTDLVWYMGLPEWKPAGSLVELEFIFKEKEGKLPPPLPKQAFKEENQESMHATSSFNEDDLIGYFEAAPYTFSTEETSFKYDKIIVSIKKDEDKLRFTIDYLLQFKINEITINDLTLSCIGHLIKNDNGTYSFDYNEPRHKGHISSEWLRRVYEIGMPFYLKYNSVINVNKEVLNEENDFFCPLSSISETEFNKAIIELKSLETQESFKKIVDFEEYIISILPKEQDKRSYLPCFHPEFSGDYGAFAPGNISDPNHFVNRISESFANLSNFSLSSYPLPRHYNIPETIADGIKVFGRYYKAGGFFSKECEVLLAGYFYGKYENIYSNLLFIKVGDKTWTFSMSWGIFFCRQIRPFFSDDFNIKCIDWKNNSLKILSAEGAYEFHLADEKQFQDQIELPEDVSKCIIDLYQKMEDYAMGLG